MVSVWLISGFQKVLDSDELEQISSSGCIFMQVLYIFQVKVMTGKELLATACEQFLGKSVEDIKSVLLQTLEGHLRAILGILFCINAYFAVCIN